MTKRKSLLARFLLGATFIILTQLLLGCATVRIQTPAGSIARGFVPQTTVVVVNNTNATLDVFQGRSVACVALVPGGRCPVVITNYGSQNILVNVNVTGVNPDGTLAGSAERPYSVNGRQSGGTGHRDYTWIVSNLQWPQ